MIKVYCNLCRKELVKPGALVFTPPASDGRVFKYHVCVERCWPTVAKMLTGVIMAGAKAGLNVKEGLP